MIRLVNRPLTDDDIRLGQEIAFKHGLLDDHRFHDGHIWLYYQDAIAKAQRALGEET